MRFSVWPRLNEPIRYLFYLGKGPEDVGVLK